ncbi:MAG: hypothetical protein DRN20_04000 [Thermoplasmata archaeon]|nr:MAG: hypothetical protein DRN20_04000 [Thermoplasmata archaeon]
MVGPRIAMVYTKRHMIHRPSTASPENPERIEKIYRYVYGKKDSMPFLNIIEDFEPAKLSDLLRVHERNYVDFVRNYCNRGGGFLGNSTYFGKNSYIAATYAAGGAIKAADIVYSREYDFSFALVRPPGHHASSDKYGGFCIFNNGAIAARYLQEVRGAKRIMFIDWDAHAANGTMEVFYDDPTVLLISIHRDPNIAYPHDGFLHQIGRGRGRGYTINIEMPEGSGDAEYARVFNEIIAPVYRQYSPDFVIGCNGFDSYYKDPYEKLMLTAQGYYEFVGSIAKLVGKNRFMVLMEGGYNKDNGLLTEIILNAMAGVEMEFEDSLDTLSSSMMRREKVSKVLDDKLRDLKNILSDFFDL